MAMSSKPHNVFLKSDPGKPFPRVLLGDFGQSMRESNLDIERKYMVVRALPFVLFSTQTILLS